VARIPPDEQLLRFGDEELRDHHALWMYHVGEGDTLVLDMEVFLLIDRGDLVLSMALSRTVWAVKCAIQQARGSSPAQQQLLFRGCELDDPLPLWYYSIADGDTLQLDELLSLGVRGVSSSVVLYIEVSRSCKIHRVKDCIKQASGIPIANQRLFAQDTLLCNSKAVWDYDIAQGDTLVLERTSDWKEIGPQFKLVPIWRVPTE